MIVTYGKTIFGPWTVWAEKLFEMSLCYIAFIWNLAAKRDVCVIPCTYTFQLYK